MKKLHISEKAVKAVQLDKCSVKVHEENSLQKGIEKLVEQSGAFQFLADEEDLYAAKDIKEKY